MLSVFILLVSHKQKETKNKLMEYGRMVENCYKKYDDEVSGMMKSLIRKNSN